MSDIYKATPRPANARATFGKAAPKSGASFVAKPAKPSIDRTESRALPADLEIGRVISRTFAILAPYAVTFVALVAIAAIPERLAVHLTGMDSKYVSAISKILLFLIAFALQPAVTKGALDALHGERPNLGACLGAGLGQFFPIMGITVLCSLGIVAGSLLLLVPGLMLALSWSIVVPVRVAEGLGVMTCLGRSRKLAIGHRWKILALALMDILLVIATGLALSPFWGAFSLHGLPAFINANWLVSLSTTMIGGVGKTVLYDELVRINEGGSQRQLADVFD